MELQKKMEKSILIVFSPANYKLQITYMQKIKCNRIVQTFENLLNTNIQLKVMTKHKTLNIIPINTHLVIPDIV